MKIALVCKTFSLKKGGMERYTVLLSRELVRSGHDVHVFANSWDEEPGLALHHVPLIRLASPLKNLSFALFSRRILSGLQFDVIHSMERILHQDIFRVSDGISPVQLAQRHRNALVRSVQACGARRLALRYLESRIFSSRGAMFIMANSNLVKDQIIEHYGVDPERIVVIHNGIDPSRFNPSVREAFRVDVRKELGIGEDDLVALFISHDFKLKQLDLVIRAVAQLDRKQIKLCVVGRDRAEPYARLAKRMGIEQQVIFMGPQRDLEKFYGASDIFVLPTLYDAFSNVCLEAMACGLPAITTPMNGAADKITDGENGLLLQSKKPQELAGKINGLLPKEERLRMGARAAADAGECTMKRHMDRVFELYETVCKRKKNPHG